MKALRQKIMVLIMCLVFSFVGCIQAYADTDMEEINGENEIAAVSSGVITASDHWILPVRDIAGGTYSDLYSGAEGYTVSSTYHRTSVEYLVSWKSVKVSRKWGTGKVQVSTGYVRPPYSNTRAAFKSAVYYEF